MKTSRPGGRRPEGTGALMRAVRAIVSLFHYLATLGGAVRKVAEVTGLGSGMPRAKGEKQLLAKREIQVQLVQFQRHLGGKGRGQLRSERRQRSENPRRAGS